MPTTTLDGATLHWREAGSGDRVLLLLHAFPLHSGMWEPQIAPLAAKGWRVIAPDARGFGGSSPAPDVLGMDVIADDAVRLLAHLGVAKAVVGGLSMGGYAAFELWRRRKDLVRALLLADTRAGADSDEGRANRETFARTALEKGIEWVAAEMAPKLVTRTGDAVRGIIRENAPAAVAAAQRGMARRGDSRPLLPAADVPALVVVGADDTLTPPSESRAMHEALAGSSLVELPGAGHLSNLDAPDAFTAAVAGWLASLA